MVEIVSVELPVMPGVKLTNPGLREAVSPVGVTTSVEFKVIIVVRPRLCTVRWDDVEFPATMLVGDSGPAVIVKSGVTVRRKVVE